MPSVRPLFVDTGAFYAYIVSADDNHAHVKGVFEEALDAGRELLTTNSIVLET